MHPTKVSREKSLELHVDISPACSQQRKYLQLTLLYGVFEGCWGNFEMALFNEGSEMLLLAMTSEALSINDQQQQQQAPKNHDNSMVTEIV